MQSYEVSVQPGGISRNWDEDPDPRDAGWTPPPCFAPARVLQPAAAHGEAERPVLRARTLVVGLRGAGAQFVENCLRESAEFVAAVVQPWPGEQDRAPLTVEEAAEEPEAALLFRSDDLLTLAVQYAIPAECARSWALALLDAVSVDRVLVLESIPTHDFFCRGDVPLPPALFKLEANCGAVVDTSRILTLPAPNHASGAAAALLTQSLFSNVSCRVFLSVQDTQDISPSTLLAYAPLVELFDLGADEQQVHGGCVRAAALSARSSEVLLRNRMYL